MSEVKMIGRISLERQSPRVIRVVKAADRNETPAAKRERLDIAMLRLLVPAYPEIAISLVKELPPK